MAYSITLTEEYMKVIGVEVNKMEKVSILQLMDCKEKEHGNKGK